MEEVAEHLGQRRRVEDAGGPARAGAEDVAVGEAAACNEAVEVGQTGAAFKEVGHVDIHRLAPGFAEGRRHLDMAVDALLAEYRDARRHGERDFAGFVRLVGEAEFHAGVGGVGREGELLVCALGIVAQRLHGVGRLGPHRAEGADVSCDGGLAIDRDGDVAVVAGMADADHVLRQAGGAEARQHFGGLRLIDFEDGAQLFGEERAERSVLSGREVGVEAAPAAKGHLAECGGHAAVGAVMVGEEESVGYERLHRREELQEEGWIGEVGRNVADLR